MTRRHWTVRLSDTAEADYDEIVRWTARRFCASQAAPYGDLLDATLARQTRGPTPTGVRQRDEIGTGLHTLHVGRRGRHVILFRVGSEPDNRRVADFARRDGPRAACAVG